MEHRYHQEVLGTCRSHEAVARDGMLRDTITALLFKRSRIYRKSVSPEVKRTVLTTLVSTTTPFTLSPKISTRFTKLFPLFLPTFLSPRLSEMSMVCTSPETLNCILSSSESIKPMPRRRSTARKTSPSSWSSMVGLVAAKRSLLLASHMVLLRLTWTPISSKPFSAHAPPPVLFSFAKSTEIAL